jgi:hypothetical protein
MIHACGSGDDFSGTNAKSSASRVPVTTMPAAKPASHVPPTTAPAAAPVTTQSAVFVPPTTLPPPTTVPAAPPGSVTKGSFTVWTEPSDPAPFQNYTVVIEVKLPANTASYTASDLSGAVEGTDGYLQTIGNGETQPFEHLGSIAHLRLMVPGAAQLVRDNVKIYSTLLHEQQTIGIEF